MAAARLLYTGEGGLGGEGGGGRIVGRGRSPVAVACAVLRTGRGAQFLTLVHCSLSCAGLTLRLH
jgi:hypothetical protein